MPLTTDNMLLPADEIQCLLTQISVDKIWKKKKLKKKSKSMWKKDRIIFFRPQLVGYLWGLGSLIPLKRETKFHKFERINISTKRYTFFNSGVKMCLPVAWAVTNLTNIFSHIWLFWKQRTKKMLSYIYKNFLFLKKKIFFHRNGQKHKSHKMFLWLKKWYLANKRGTLRESEEKKKNNKLPCRQEQEYGRSPAATVRLLHVALCSQGSTAHPYFPETL